MFIIPYVLTGPLTEPEIVNLARVAASEPQAAASDP